MWSMAIYFFSLTTEGYEQVWFVGFRNHHRGDAEWSATNLISRTPKRGTNQKAILTALWQSAPAHPRGSFLHSFCLRAADSQHAMLARPRRRTARTHVRRLVQCGPSDSEMDDFDSW